MNKVFVCVCVTILCFACTSFASNVDVTSTKSALSKSSGNYKEIERWIHEYGKANNNVDMENANMFGVFKVSLSKNVNTYFAMYNCGNANCGGSILTQINRSYSVIYTGDEFKVVSGMTNGYHDLVSHSQGGAGNDYVKHYKYDGREYKMIESVMYGYNSQFDKDLSNASNKGRRIIWTYKYVEGSGDLKHGVIVGNIKYIIQPKGDKNNKILVIQDVDNDLIAVLVSNKGANIVKSMFKDYKTARLSFEWKTIAFTEGEPRDNVITITNVKR